LKSIPSLPALHFPDARPEGPLPTDAKFLFFIRTVWAPPNAVNAPVGSIVAAE
jgi:hypothetical protein